MRQHQAKTLIVSGTLTLDTLELEQAEPLESPGGSALYAAAAASLLCPTAVVGIVGTDFPLRNFDVLVERGVDLGAVDVRPGRTFRWRARYTQTGDRVTVSRDAGVAGDTIPDVPESLSEGRPSVLLASTDPAIQLGVLKQINKPGWVGLDTMDHWIEERRIQLDLLLRRVDVVFATEDEVCLLGGSANPLAAAETMLNDGPRAVVVKRGPEGSWLKRRGREPIQVPARATDTTVETTGAGDAFAGGFMASLVRHRVLNDDTGLNALAHGSACATLAVRAVGINGLRTVTPEDKAESTKFVLDLLSGRSDAAPMF